MEVCLASSVRVRRSGQRGRAPAHPGGVSGGDGDGGGGGADEPHCTLQATRQILKAFWGRGGGDTSRKDMKALPGCRNVAMGG